MGPPLPYDPPVMSRRASSITVARVVRRDCLLPFVAAVLAALMMLAMTGCMTGERPTLNTAPTAAGVATGDPAIDAVLTLLDGVSNAVFTADYTSTLAFNGAVTRLQVSQSSPTRRSVTIGDVRYHVDGGDTQTCHVSTGACQPGTDTAAVSDTGVTVDFAFGDIARRLRRDASARVAATEGSQSTVGGQNATCVGIPVTGGTKTYCVFADGVLARFLGGDVTIELSGYLPTATESLFTTDG